jgi:hypothetical protein
MSWKKELLSFVLIMAAAFLLGLINDLIFYHDPLANVEDNLKIGFILAIIIIAMNLIIFGIQKAMDHHKRKRRR